MRPSPVLLRACGRGNQMACNIAKKLRIMYAASVLSFSDVNLKDDNDNRMPFVGTLLLLDVASDKPPHGSEGHRIFVSKKAAEEALPNLVGQAVNYQPENLSAHVSRHKVGVITRAWIEGNKVKVAGQIWIHDFPEAKVLKGRKDLGMSMELSSVYVQDDQADVWVLEKFDFTGATILLKKAAAYTKTDLAAVAAAAKGMEGDSMPKHNKERKVAAANKDTGQETNLALMTQALSGSLGTAMKNAVEPLVGEIKASNAAVIEGIEELKGLQLTQIHASADTDDDEDDGIVLNAAEDDASASSSASDEEEEEMEASASEASDMEARGEEDDDEDDDSSSSATESDMEAMEDLELEDASQHPGEVNKDAAPKGRKTTVSNPPKQAEHFKNNVAKGRLSSAAARRVKAQGKSMKKQPTASSIQAAALIGDLQASVRQLKKRVKAQAEEHNQIVGKLRKKLTRVTAQMENFARLEGRRSAMSHELVSLGEKVGVDFNETRNNGQKYSVRAFDSILAAAEKVGVVLNPTQRVHIKMLAEQSGVLDEGLVDRGFGRA